MHPMMMTPPETRDARLSFQLGINHHLLFPESMQDDAIHEATLRDLAAWPEFDVLDLYLAGDDAQRAREAAYARESGKRIIYNMPLLYTMPGCNPNATDPAVQARTQAVALRHLDAAAMAGSSLMLIASGPNPPAETMEDAWNGWMTFLLWLGREAAQRNMRVAVEPFDQSVGKNLLIGPTRTAVRMVEEAHAYGGANIGLIVDMGHLPIMGETFDEAVALSRPYLWHIHLGNAVIDDPQHPWFGDCHPPIGIDEGRHQQEHLRQFLDVLTHNGYFSSTEATLTLEMRPYAGMSPRCSVERWLRMLAMALPHQ